jgi:hypothetical protein
VTPLPGVVKVCTEVMPEMMHRVCYKGVRQPSGYTTDIAGPALID